MAQLTAVLPAAGLGTRLRPLTDWVPKELLPLGEVPVIGHALAEVHVAGVTQAVIVISERKDALRGYCGDGLRWGLQCRYVLQPEMRGVGDAVLCAVRDGVRGPLLVAFADCAILRRASYRGTPSTARLVQLYEATQADAVVLCEEVPRERTRHYGVLAPADPTPVRGEPFRLRGVVEKPDPAEAPSNFVVAARWILGPAVLTALARQTPGPNGEIGIVEAVAEVIASGGEVWALPVSPGERRCDVGNPRSYVLAQAFAALNHPDYGPEARQV